MSRFVETDFSARLLPKLLRLGDDPCLFESSWPPLILCDPLVGLDEPPLIELSRAYDSAMAQMRCDC